MALEQVFSNATRANISSDSIYTIDDDIDNTDDMVANGGSISVESPQIVERTRGIIDLILNDERNGHYKKFVSIFQLKSLLRLKETYMIRYMSSSETNEESTVGCVEKVL